MFAAGCFLLVLASPRPIFDTGGLTLIRPMSLGALVDWALQLHWILGLLVIAPFAISYIVVSSVQIPCARDFRLIAGDSPRNGSDARHAVEDEAMWQRRRVAVETSWKYERDRILKSHHRLSLHALIFGNMASFVLACGVLALPPSPWGSLDVTARVVCSVIAATGTAFLATLVRVMLRISGGDATSRTFAWATRSLILVIIADIGLFVILQNETTSVTGALLLGIFVGATGDHAIQFLLDQGGKAFGTGKREEQRSSPLADFEGMTPEHVERLEEEGILSVHDLAFVPTARLFFATAYSLQQICDWQDRALLQVYVGKKAAEALAEKLDIRGALDLRAFAHDILFGERRSSTEPIKNTLREALGLDEGGFAALLDSIAHDEVAMRIRCYWSCVVGGPDTQLEATRETTETVAGAGGTPLAAIVVSGSLSAEAGMDHRALELPIADVTLEVTTETLRPAK